MRIVELITSALTKHRKRLTLSKKKNKDLSEQVFQIRKYYLQYRTSHEFQEWYEKASSLSVRQFEKEVNNKSRKTQYEIPLIKREETIPNSRNNVGERLVEI